jgi:RNA polymerase sigma factor (sigma-70 family)|tara:strand:+ start:253 stop:705 length:453 start_codon:yes stop_codon:yes gene_type:complete
MQELIEKNMGLVVSVVESFRPKSSEERDSYIQAGRIGLWKALKKYDPSKGAALSTFAWNPIRWEIIKEIKTISKNKGYSISQMSGFCYEKKSDFSELYPNNLTEEEAFIMDLRRSGYKLREICDIIERGRSYVKKTVYRAISKIRDANEE